MQVTYKLSQEYFGGEILLTGYLASHSITVRADLSSLPPRLLFKLFSSAFLSTHRSPGARAEEPFLWSERKAEGQGGSSYYPA